MMLSNKKWKRQKSLYESLHYLSLLCLLISLIALFAIIIFVFVQGGSSLSWDFLFGEYVSSPTLLPAMLGTLELILISIVIAVPLGIMSAIYLVEYSKSESKIALVVRTAIQTLSSIPSIVYGLFGYLVFVVFFKWGYTILGGGFTLAIMVLPIVVKNVEEALKEVPMNLREASYALGSGKLRTIFKVVLPSAMPGISTSIILSIGRVVSESAVLLLTIGNVVNLVPTSLLSPGTSLALDIYYFATFGYAKQASATAVVLLVLVLGINIIAYLLSSLFSRRLNHGK